MEVGGFSRADVRYYLTDGVRHIFALISCVAKWGDKTMIGRNGNLIRGRIDDFSLKISNLTCIFYYSTYHSSSNLGDVGGFGRAAISFQFDSRRNCCMYPITMSGNWSNGKEDVDGVGYFCQGCGDPKENKTSPRFCWCKEWGKLVVQNIGASEKKIKTPKKQNLKGLLKVRLVMSLGEGILQSVREYWI